MIIITCFLLLILIVWNLLLIRVNNKDNDFDGFGRSNKYHWAAVVLSSAFILAALMQTRLFGSY